MTVETLRRIRWEEEGFRNIVDLSKYNDDDYDARIVDGIAVSERWLVVACLYTRYKLWKGGLSNVLRKRLFRKGRFTNLRMVR